MGLTAEDIQTLEQPLPVDDHEFREAGKNSAKTKVQWLVYVNLEGVIPLLNRIDPNWSWEVRETSIQGNYVYVSGRLTIKGVSRDGIGGRSPNGRNAPVDEDVVKGAETDALKRAAVRFGVGLYLRSAPMIWVPYNETSYKPWEAEKEVARQFTAWYSRTFGGQPTQRSTAQLDENTGEIITPPAPSVQPPADDADNDLLWVEEFRNKEGATITPIAAFTTDRVAVRKAGKGRKLVFTAPDNKPVESWTRKPLEGVIDAATYEQLANEGAFALGKTVRVHWKANDKGYREVEKIEAAS